MNITLFQFLELSILSTTIVATLWGIINGFISDIVKFGVGYIKSRLIYSFTCNTEEGGDYNHIVEWIADNAVDKFPNLTPFVSGLTNRLLLIPGFGIHFFWYKNALLIINHHKVNNEQSSISTLTIHVPFFWKKKYSEFHEMVSNVSYDNEEENINLYYLHEYSWNHTYKPKRNLEHFYLKNEVKDEINADLEWFLKNKDFYRFRGIPWNRGYQLSGSPGSGKTTLAFILAGKYNLPIYYMNLNSIKNDDFLNILFMQINSDNAIILIEDIDTFKAAKKRKIIDEEDDNENSNGISLSGLLNAIDGVLAREGKIVIMTTNHPKNLDPALTRFGRIDKKFEIDVLCADETARMFLAFFPAHPNMKSAMEKYASKHLKVAAEWQDIFIRHQQSPEALFKILTEE